MQYLKFLQILISLGDKLPAILKAIQALIDALGTAFPPKAGSTEEGSLNLTADRSLENPEEIANAESQVAALAASGTRDVQAAFDGSRLRTIFAILQASGLLDAMMAYLLKRMGES